MRISDVMTREVEVVRPDTTLQQAAQKMKKLDIGPLPVCDETGRLLGMVTDRDITIRATAEGKDPKTTPVDAVMSAGVITCYPDDDVSEAQRIMSREQIRRLVVTDRAKNIVGVVSIGDLATEALRDRDAGAALREISEENSGGGGARRAFTGILAVIAMVIALIVAAGGMSETGGDEPSDPVA